jgi:hypothetical protein
LLGNGNVGIALSTSLGHLLGIAWSLLVNTSIWPSFDADQLAILKTVLSLDVVAVVVFLLDTVVLMWLQRAISRSAPTGKLCRIVNVNTLTCTLASTLALTSVLVSLIRCHQLRSRSAMFTLTYLLVDGIVTGAKECFCFFVCTYLLVTLTLLTTVLLPVPKILVIHAFKRYVLAQAAQRTLHRRRWMDVVRGKTHARRAGAPKKP